MGSPPLDADNQIGDALVVWGLRMKFASLAAAAALVLVFVGIGAFVVRAMQTSRDSAAHAHRSTDISAAYEEARYSMALMQFTATAHLRVHTPETRAAFDESVAAGLAAFEHIRDIGEPEDAAAMERIIREELPALEAIQRIFLALERGLPITDTLPDDQVNARILAIIEPRAEELRASSAAELHAMVNRQERDLRITVAVCTAGLALVVVLLLATITFGRKEAFHKAEVSRLEKAALTDSLTGLGNHRAFLEELRRQVARAQRHGEHLTLALIDIDEFKEINDTWGHARGDAVLLQVGRLLAEYCREDDYAFRIGGDEFAMILPHTEVGMARTALNRLRSTVARVLGDAPTLSIGVASTDTCDGDESVLRQQADSALYDAKLSGRDMIVRFDPRDETPPAFPAAKLAAIRRLVAEGTVDVDFQPIWNLADHSLMAHEALARIPAEYGIDGPQLAFDIAERIGKSAELDELCRGAVLGTVHELPTGSLLFVNISPYTLSHSSFSAEDVRDKFRAAGFEPEQVVLEVTERSTVPVPVIEAAVRRLRGVGFRTALDDVGSGNAGLEMLRRVPVDFVKIDRDVLLSALEGPMGRATVMAIVAFASQAGALAVAEGIEDARMMDLVRWASEGGDASNERHIFAVQGYLFGRPAKDFADHLPDELAA